MYIINFLQPRPTCQQNRGLLVDIGLLGLSSVLHPEGSGRKRMDYNSSCNLIALACKTEENRLLE